jgi:PKD repeat protein
MVRPSRYVGLAAATLAILAVLSLGFGGMTLSSPGSLSRASMSPNSSAAGHPSAGPAQLASARASLALAHTSHSSVSRGPASELSPGGYTWSNLTGIESGIPTARLGEAMTWDASDGYVLLFGGENQNSVPIGDTWSYANGTWTNLTGLITGGPPALVLAGLAFDPSSHTVILFGGLNSSSAAAGWTWSYHNRTWTNISASVGTAPSGRLATAMSTDSTDGQILLFGGSNGSGSWLGDTWTFKASHWTNVTAIAGSGFGALELPVGSDDPQDHGDLVWGVYPSGSSVRTATLLYSGGSWRNVSSSLTSQPPATELGAAGYLASISSIVFVSGVAYNRTGSPVIEGLTAEYTPGTWNNVTSVTAGPPVLYVLAAGAVIGSDQSFLAFGSAIGGSTFLPTTWLLSAPPKVGASVNHAVVDQGTSVSFTGSVSEGAAPFVYHWSFGDGSTASTLSGAHAFAHPGTYAANLTVSDFVGHSVTASVSVVVNPPLTFAASATPSPATANSTVALTSTLSGGTPPFTYRWTLGDASTSTSPSLGHIYTKAGNYPVTANVTDALGQSASSTFTLVVNAAATTSSSGSSSSSSVSLTSGTGLYLLLGIVLLAIVVVALAVLLARRPKSPSGPPAQYYSGQGAPPVGAGPTGAPPAAWSETPPQPPR